MNVAERKTVTKAVAQATGLPRDVLVALHETAGVGRLTILGVLQYGASRRAGCLKDAATLKEADWRDMGLRQSQAEAVVRSLTPEAMERRDRRRRQRRLEIVTLLDDHYPRLLRHIADPPWVLYYRGNWELTRRPAVAIVGTRQATGYGRLVAERLAAAAAARMTVVSGLARGIDAAAHLGALPAPCGTIAVMAGGADHVYPPENRRLWEEIAARGLIVSEMPPDTAVTKGLFPLRNRIIAGLSLGVVLVEGGDSSGSLITADLALGYDRDVFVVPGPVTSPRSQGSLGYFRKGGRPLLDAGDLFEYYQSVLPPEDAAPTATGPAEGPFAGDSGLTDDEKRIYDYLLDQPCSTDELVEASGMSFGHLNTVLLSLCIKRRIGQQPGSVYSII